MKLIRSSKPFSFSFAGFTLMEGVFSMAIAAIGMVSIVSGYVLSAQRAEWSACSSAAEAKAMERIEQTRAAKWDNLASPPIDEIVSSNFPVLVASLSIPMTRSNVMNATNTTTITMISTTPPLKMIRVDCVWAFMSRGPFTNTIFTYRGPDQ